MKANEVIKKVLDEHGEITEVYWVACGGSLIDLYPSHFLMNVESAKTSSGWHTAKEFLVATPKKLGKHSLVVMCSHSGNTKEAVDAAVLAYERGAAVVTLTDNAGSKAVTPASSPGYTRGATASPHRKCLLASARCWLPS